MLFSRRTFKAALATIPVLIGLGFAPSAFGAQETASRYDIQATFDAAARTIEGTVQVTLTNTSTEPISSLAVVLYPNYYAQPDSEHLNDMNWLWVYPGSFSAGRMRLTSASVDGRSLEPVLEADDRPGTVARLTLARPLAPSATLTLELGFDVLVPEKYGSFGVYRRTLTANGGWYPYLPGLRADGSWALDAPPPRATFDVDLTLTEPRDTFLNGQYFEQTNHATLRDESATLVSLVSAPRYHLVEHRGDDVVVRFYEFKEGRYAEGDIPATLADFIERATGSIELAPSSREVTIVETYMRRNVARPGEGMILLSDEAFKALKNFGLRDLNRLALVRAYAYQLVRDHVYETENLEDVHWVAQALAWGITETYRKSGFLEVADIRETASRFGMFRPFNQMADAPTVPFTATYVRNVTTDDPLRESVYTFRNELPIGRLIYLKLKNEIGEDNADRVLRDYPTDGRVFRELASDVADENLGWFFDQWLQAFPDSIQYRLVDVSTHTDDGKTTTDIEIERLSSRPIVERVPVALTLADGEEQLVWWDGREDRGTLRVETESTVQLVEVDPNHETFDNVQADNRSPRPWEMVIDRGEVFVNTGGLGAAMRFRFRRKDTHRHEVYLQPFFSPAQVGISGGYFYNFGRQRPPWFFRRTQQINFMYAFADLRSGFAEPESGQIDGIGQLSFVQAQYSYDDQVFDEDPMSRKTLKANVQIASDDLGGDFNFYKVWTQASMVRAINPHHKMAVQGVIGHSDAFGSSERIPAQAMFDGVVWNRGLSFGDALGRNISNVRAEWRFDPFKDIDVLMPFMWARRIQMNLGMDATWVSEDFGDLFTLDDTRLAVVMGMRLHYDFFGFRPSDLTVDFGKEIGHGDRSSGFVINLGILQSF